VNIDLGNICIYLVVLAIILFILFIIYLFYFSSYGVKKGKMHRCNFCGQMVDVISDCCNAPVKEQFLVSVCINCGKDCNMVCARCRKNIAGQ
jgi:hypothetical protein